MKKLNITYKGAEIQLNECKDVFDNEKIKIYENGLFVGDIDKIHDNDIDIVAQKILCGYSYDELEVETYNK